MVERELSELVRPTTLAVERTLPVLDPLVPLFPSGALVRGTVLGVSGSGLTSLALALAAGPSRAGSWVGFVGCPGIGWASAAEQGLDLARCLSVPEVPGGRWAAVCAAMVDAVDVVVVSPGQVVRPADCRRLANRVRERGVVLVVAGGRHRWPGEPEATLEVGVDGGVGGWSGIGDGHGHLRARRVSVEASGRRASARPRRVELWLPGLEAAVATAGTAPVMATVASPFDPDGVDVAGASPFDPDGVDPDGVDVAGASPFDPDGVDPDGVDVAGASSFDLAGARASAGVGLRQAG